MLMMVSRPAIRVLIISRRTLVLEGLAALLGGQPQMQLVAAVSDVRDVAAFEGDVVLWDVDRMNAQPLPFPFLALLGTPDQAHSWFDAGAAGCILATDSVEDLLSALRQVARGETFLSAPILQQMVTGLGSGSEVSRPSLESLTEREREVLRLLAGGLSNKAIAQRLYVSVRTVEGHLANLYAKLRVRSRTEAAVLAMQHGWTAG